MTITIEDITDSNLSLLFDWSDEGRKRNVGCKFCLYWEEPDTTVWPESLQDRQAMKANWFAKVRREFGPCGKLAFSDSRLVGYTQYAPPAWLLNVQEYDCGPPSDDAVFISCLYVRHQEGKGVGSVLLQAVLDDLRTRGVLAVETFALKGSKNNPSGPLDFWLRKGFSVVREDKHFALVRKELACADWTLSLP